MSFQFQRLFFWLAIVATTFGSPSHSSGEDAVIVNDTLKLQSQYDFIVVGGGTSGLVVANRLTEDPNVQVLVIEYGYVDGQENGTSVPGLTVPKKYLRTYTSIPQVGLDNRTSPLYTGAGVGGGTVVNGMFFNRGSASDYNAWEKLGNPGWGWKDLLPYFKKSETFTPPSKEIQKEFPAVISDDLSPHGTNGPVGSSFSNFQYPIMHNFVRGWNSIGLATQPQPNAGDANGVFFGPISLKAVNQSRSSASNAYYRPIIGKRPNFHLITGQTVTNINFDKSLIASSVNIVARSSSGHDDFTVIKARREIILAAGAVRSPQILQLSGIGPKNLLSSHAIKTLVDLPGVGQNFQDQPSMFLQYAYGKSYPFPSPDWLTSNASWAAEQLEVYYTDRRGPMTIPHFSGSMVAFLPLENMTTSYQEILVSASAVNLTALTPAGTDPTITAGYKAQADQLLALYDSTKAAVEEVAWGGGDTVSVAMIRPFSRGTIKINSTDASDAPIIDFGTFSHPTDMDVAVESLKKVRQWMASAAMQEVEAKEIYPGANVTSDQQIADAIRNFATSSWQHPTSSCAMLKRKLGGVVDSELKVYGVKNLRIVDASIFPMAIGGHTSSTVYAVAEKAADIIKSALEEV